MSLIGGGSGMLYQTALVSSANPEDYIALLKPRVMSLVVFTALTGMLMSPDPVNPIIGFASLVAISVGAGASGALNMWYESDIDSVMKRTKSRPIPMGRINRQEALAFGSVLAILSVFTLYLAANLSAASFLAFTIFFYVVIYTMWLKRRTPQNIVIGGAAGAFPPLVAYISATGHISLSSISLFAIIFFWTPPHFWALALIKSEEYAKANIPMLPNVKGPDRTRLEILLYTCVLVPVALLPWYLNAVSNSYAVLASVLGVMMLGHAVEVFRHRSKPLDDLSAKKLFRFSIFYLFLLFGEIFIERVILIARHSFS